MSTNTNNNNNNLLTWSYVRAISWKLQVNKFFRPVVRVMLNCRCEMSYSCIAEIDDGCGNAEGYGKLRSYFKTAFLTTFKNPFFSFFSSSGCYCTVIAICTPIPVQSTICVVSVTFSRLAASRYTEVGRRKTHETHGWYDDGIEFFLRHIYFTLWNFNSLQYGQERALHRRTVPRRERPKAVYSRG